MPPRTPPCATYLKYSMHVLNVYTTRGEIREWRTDFNSAIGFPQPLGSMNVATCGSCVDLSYRRLLARSACNGQLTRAATRLDGWLGSRVLAR